jgi:hypothetical protein
MSSTTVSSDAALSQTMLNCFLNEFKRSLTKQLDGLVKPLIAEAVEAAALELKETTKLYMEEGYGTPFAELAVYVVQNGEKKEIGGR